MCVHTLLLAVCRSEPAGRKHGSDRECLYTVCRRQTLTLVYLLVHIPDMLHFRNSLRPMVQSDEPTPSVSPEYELYSGICFVCTSIYLHIFQIRECLQITWQRSQLYYVLYYGSFIVTMLQPVYTTVVLWYLVLVLVLVLIQTLQFTGQIYTQTARPLLSAAQRAELSSAPCMMPYTWKWNGEAIYLCVELLWINECQIFAIIHNTTAVSHPCRIYVHSERAGKSKKRQVYLY